MEFTEKTLRNFQLDYCHNKSIWYYPFIYTSIISNIILNKDITNK